MPKLPLVSVITPCFNGELHVERLIRSVLAQTYANIEFVLVNDGSTDSTHKIVMGLKPLLDATLTRFVYVEQSNAGLGGAINAGLAQTTGDYLCWPDADDYLEPESVERRVEVLQRHLEYAVVTSDAYLRSSRPADRIVGRISEEYSHNHDPWQFERLLVGDSIFTPGCHMARMDAFDDTHPGRQIHPARRGQNWQMLLPLYYKYRRYFLDTPLYNYVVHEGSMSRSDDSAVKMLERLEEHRTIRRIVLESMDLTPAERERWLKVSDERFLRGAFDVAIRYTNLELAQRSYSELVRRRPLGLPRRMRYIAKLLLLRLRLMRRWANRGPDAAQSGLVASGSVEEGAPLATSSVLVTTYNGERFIEEQLASILEQTSPVDQVLIVDDGSTDSTVQLVTNFIEERGLVGWRLEVNPTNLGVAANVLTHLEGLTGDLIFFADQDDVWERTKVEVMADIMVRNPQVEMVVSGSTPIDADGTPTSPATGEEAATGMKKYLARPGVNTLDFNDYFGYSLMPLHAMVMRGVLARRIGAEKVYPDLSRSLGADWYLGMCSVLTGDAVWIPDALVRRRIHDSNISLGRLRKTTILSGTREQRCRMLAEAGAAHGFVLRSPFTGPLLDERQRHLLAEAEKWYGHRQSFTERPSVAAGLALLLRLRHYVRSADGLPGGVRMWLSDVAYAYDINWQLKRRGDR